MQRGVVLGEVVLSVLIVCGLSYATYLITTNINRHIRDLMKEEKALYVAKLRMAQVTARNFANLTDEVGCKSADSVIGINGYLPGAQVCVAVGNLSGWTGWSTGATIAVYGEVKNVVVTVDW